MPVARLTAMGMRLLCHFDRHHRQAAISDTTLGDDMLGAMLDVARMSLEDDDLHTAFVVKMDVKCRVGHVVMIVERLHKAAGEISRGMIVDVNEGSHAIAALAEFVFRLRNSSPRQVPDGLRSILIAPRLDDAVKIDHEIVVEGDGYALHGGSLLSAVRFKV
jgi:hypothetical protein